LEINPNHRILPPMNAPLSLLRLFSLFSCCLVFSGCSTLQPKPPPSISTDILSDPPGARIEVNGNYVGDAPVTVTLEQWADGVIKGRQLVRALPKESGHYTQERELRGPEFPFDPHRDRVPTRMIFDTHLRPLQPASSQLSR
jgi:hypothetical protein